MHANRTITAVALPLLVMSDQIAELAAKPGLAPLDFETESAGR
jgi:hypothetical protein